MSAASLQMNVPNEVITGIIEGFKTTVMSAINLKYLNKLCKFSAESHTTSFIHWY